MTSRTASLGMALVLSAAILGAGCVEKHRVKPPRVDVRPPPTTLEEAWTALPGLPAPAEHVLLSDNVEAWAARWELISSAKERIDVSYFIVEPDTFGLAFLGLLLEKAHQGVKIRLLLDARGSIGFTLDFHEKDFLQELADAGVEVWFYNPVESKLLSSLLTLRGAGVVASTHDKIIVVDRERAIIGGRNITARYFSDPRDDASAWVDADVLVRGERAVREIEDVFWAELQTRNASRLRPGNAGRKHADCELLLFRHAMEIWLNAAPLHVDDARVLLDHKPARHQTAVELADAASLRHVHAPTPQARTHLIGHLERLAGLPRHRGSLSALPRPTPPLPTVILSKPSAVGDARDTLNPALEELIASADEEIILHSAYFILSEDMVRMFEPASRRGVRIVVLTNGPTSSDNGVAQALFYANWHKAARRLPTMRLFVFAGDASLHAKRMVIDRELTIIGTYNFDPMSHVFNSEIVAVVWDPDFAGRNQSEMLSRILEEDVLEYRIQRDRRGNAVMDGDKPVILFGPDDHMTPKQIERLERLNRQLKNLDGVMEFTPIQ